MSQALAGPTPTKAAILRGGAIFFGGRAVPCVVRALSEGGARLQVYSPDRLPKRFRLYVELGRIEVDCELAWLKGKEVGVDFVGGWSQAERTGSAHAGSGGTPTPAGRISILIAEDDPDDRFLIEAAFRESGTDYELTFVENGEAALQHLARVGTPLGPQEPGLILLDLNMPRMDGRAVLRHIRADAGLARIPVVVFTTSNSDEDIEGTYDLGVSSYIVKPSHYQGLLDLVQMLGEYWADRSQIHQRA